LQEFFVDEFNPNLHLCDSGVIGENTCTGDSGAGLVVDVDGVHQVVGVVSGGTGVCGRGVPGYYARVYRYLSWIHKYV
jgi:secreted trypsin-like serine protease